MIYIYKRYYRGKLQSEVEKNISNLNAQFNIYDIFFIEPSSNDYAKIAEVIPQVISDSVIHKAELIKDIRKELDYVILRKPQVTDPVSESGIKSFKDFGITLKNFRSGLGIKIIKGEQKKILKLLTENFTNKVVDIIKDCQKLSQAKISQMISVKSRVQMNEIEMVKFLNLNDNELLELNRTMKLSLSLEELKQIQIYYKKILLREPRVIELLTIAQTWSEHCKHKTFTSSFVYTGEPIPQLVGKNGYISGSNNQQIYNRCVIHIENLMKDTIFKATYELNKRWCLSVFKDNAGVIEFDDGWAICAKVETHNHPSAIEPYGGSNTGIGGVIRDVLGCGLGAKPIANLDVFCVAPLDVKAHGKSFLNPKNLLYGLVRGVRDYGNRMGIPTVAGALYFDIDYLYNPLVYCGTIGIIKKDKIKKNALPGDLIVAIGGKTGKDGIGGATFSSKELSSKSKEEDITAVQIGNAIVEKKVEKVILRATAENLYNAITDCGAGGFSSAVGEMAADLGAEVFLEKVPLKYEGLSPSEIWLSEAQERMVLSLPERAWQRFKEICDEEDVEATIIGRFNQSGKLKLYYAEKVVGELDLKFLHHGLPKNTKKAQFNKITYPEPLIKEVFDKQTKKILLNINGQVFSFNDILIKLLSHLNICSRERVIREYDFEVQGRTILKPLSGRKELKYHSDSAVILPRFESNKAIAISCGLSPHYSRLDTFWMAINAVDEAVRNLVAVGVNPSKIALLDNFCWGDANDELELGKLIRASAGLYQVAKIYETPFISGKDSLNNYFVEPNENKRKNVLPTLLITGIGIIDELPIVTTNDLKSTNSLIYLVGENTKGLACSHFFNLFGYIGNRLAKPNLVLSKKIFRKLYQAIRNGLILSCHDISEGGLLVAISEMALSGNIGVELELNNRHLERQSALETAQNISSKFDYYELLFSEAPSRFLVEIKKENKERFEDSFKELPVYLIGKTIPSKEIIIHGIAQCDSSNKQLKFEMIRIKLERIRNYWERGLDDVTF